MSTHPVQQTSSPATENQFKKMIVAKIFDKKFTKQVRGKLVFKLGNELWV